MTETAVVARRLSVGYGTKVILSGVDAFLKPGGSTALVGSNGSGKSTLLKTLAGLLPVIDGGLEVLGRPVGELTAKVAYLSQFHQSGFVLPLQAIDVVRMARYDQRSRWQRRTKIDDEIVKESMKLMCVDDLALKPLRDLSGGQQQRAALARCLVQKARIILADEPIASLDPESSRKVMDLLQQLNQTHHCTVLVSLHQVEYAIKYCPRTIALNAGRVVYDGPSSELTPELLAELYGSNASELFAEH